MPTRNFLTSLSVIALVASGPLPVFSQEAPKDATDATKEANGQLLKELPFDDTSDFNDAKKGLIAPRHFVTRLIELRRGNSILRRDSWRDGITVTWLNPGGGEQTEEQWPTRAAQRSGGA